MATGSRSRLASRIEARSEVRQVEAVYRTDRAAASAERTIRQVWDVLLALLRSARSPQQAHQRTQRLLAELIPRVRQELRDQLGRIAQWGHDTSVKTLLDLLPKDYLKKAAGPLEAVREGRGRTAPGIHPVPAMRGVSLGDDRLRTNAHEVPKRAYDDTGAVGDGTSERQALTQLTEQEGVFGLGSVEPAGSISDAHLRRLMRELTFAPPSAEDLQDLVFGSGWESRLQAMAGGVDPNQLAGIVLQGFTSGRAFRQIAEDLRPFVDGVASRARLIARQEGLRIANATQKRAWDQADDVIAGYQINAVLDERTRPHHATRNGRVWLKTDAQSMQQALRMEGPDLPDEPNCRCYLTPVLAPPSEVTDDPVVAAEFENAAGRVIPDPAVYSDWFDRANERLRRIAVGARRYAAVLGRNVVRPDWSDFLDPESGHLVSVTRLRNENAIARAERKRKVDALIAARKRDILDVQALLPRL